MITNPLLEAEYKLQKQLGEEARHDIRRYMENSHRIVLEAEKKYGFKFNYGKVQGGSLDPPTLGTRLDSGQLGAAQADLTRANRASGEKDGCRQLAAMCFDARILI